MDIHNTSITRRLDATLNELQEEFAGIISFEDLDAAVRALRGSAGMSDHPSKLKKLFRMLDAAGIGYEKDQPDEYYEKLVAAADTKQIADIQDRFVLALFLRYENYPTPEDYMKRLVDRLCSEDDHWQQDSLRLRILKQFIKYGDFLRGAGFGGRSSVIEYAKSRGASGSDVEDILSYIDDGIFEPLETADKKQKKSGGKYGLLKIADDLAEGKFRVEGATKKNLYLFAMAYGMTYYLGPDQETVIYDPKTDIEKNLFRDYYTNNFVRFVTDAYRDRLAEYEIDPSGQGINYRNYAEMVYLYYISKDMSAAEKIAGSYEMIEEIRNEMRGKGGPAGRGTGAEADADASDPFTGSREKERINSEDILSMAEPDFKKYLCENYLCDTQQGNTIVNPLQLETSQTHAYDEYRMIVDGITETGMRLENCNYGLWFVDVAAFYKKEYETICDRYPDVDRERFADFMQLLLAVNNYLGYTANEESSGASLSQEKADRSIAKTSALYIDSAEKVTRSSIITAFYYYYNAIRAGSGMGSMGFREVFNDFKEGVDDYLEAAGYQLLSGKDLFDVLVAFSAYAYAVI